jgi:WD40 repeat protein
MKALIVIFAVLLLAIPGICRAEPPVLKYVRQIGVARNPDKWGWMSFVAFSPDGTMVASDGGTARNDVSMHLSFWSFPEGKLLKTFPVSPQAISPDWKYYATYQPVQAVGILGVQKPLLSLPAKAYAIHAFSPDSKFVAESYSAKNNRGARIRVLELPSGRQMSAFGRYSAGALAICPDGVTLASGQWDEVILWNMTTGARIASLRGFGRYVVGLAFNKDGSLLAAGTDLGSVQIWNVPDHKRLHSIEMEGGFVSNPAFSPDGRFVAVGIYGTGTVWLIDVHTGKVIDRAKISDLGCGSVAFSPDARYLVAPSTGGLVVRRPNDLGGTIRVFEVRAP